MTTEDGHCSAHGEMHGDCYASELNESQLIDLLCGRCATCKHWRGDGKKIARTLEETEYKDNFLSVPNTWADCGECEKLLHEMYFCEGYDSKAPEPCGVFGCVLYESM